MCLGKILLDTAYCISGSPSIGSNGVTYGCLNTMGVKPMHTFIVLDKLDVAALFSAALSDHVYW
jgi:hypothetical protein